MCPSHRCSSVHAVLQSTEMHKIYLSAPGMGDSYLVWKIVNWYQQRLIGQLSLHCQQCIICYHQSIILCYCNWLLLQQLFAEEPHQSALHVRENTKQDELDDIPCTLKTPGPFLAQHISKPVLHYALQKKLFKLVITTQYTLTARKAFIFRIDEADTLMWVIRNFVHIYYWYRNI